MMSVDVKVLHVKRKSHLKDQEKVEEVSQLQHGVCLTTLIISPDNFLERNTTLVLRATDESYVFIGSALSNLPNFHLETVSPPPTKYLNCMQGFEKTIFGFNRLQFA